MGRRSASNPNHGDGKDPLIDNHRHRICAVSGNVQSAVRMVMDIEEPTYQANRMLNAALLISSGQLSDATR